MDERNGVQGIVEVLPLKESYRRCHCCYAENSNASHSEVKFTMRASANNAAEKITSTTVIICVDCLKKLIERGSERLANL